MIETETDSRNGFQIYVAHIYCKLNIRSYSHRWSNSYRSGDVGRVHKYLTFSTPKHCIHALFNARSKAVP
jgi:hypothetical protein